MGRTYVFPMVGAFVVVCFSAQLGFSISVDSSFCCLSSFEILPLKTFDQSNPKKVPNAFYHTLIDVSGSRSANSWMELFVKISVSRFGRFSSRPVLRKALFEFD